LPFFGLFFPLPPSPLGKGLLVLFFGIFFSLAPLEIFLPTPLTVLVLVLGTFESNLLLQQQHTIDLTPTYK